MNSFLMRRPIPLVFSCFVFLSLVGPISPLMAQGQVPQPGFPGTEVPPDETPPDDEPQIDEPPVAEPPVNTAPGGRPGAVPPPVGFGQTTAPPVAAPPPDPKRDGNPTTPGNTRRSMAEIRLRGAMSDFGLDDTSKQDAVIAYLAEDEKGKETVRLASRRLMTGISRKVPADKMRGLLDVYKAALEADKARRVAAQTSLDAKIGYSLDPRVEAALFVFGILGDGQITMGFGSRSMVSVDRTPQNDQNGNPGGGNGFGGFPGGINRGGTFGNNTAGGGTMPFGGNRNGFNRTGNGNRTTAATAPQSGIVYGSVSDKGEGWIDVKMAGGASERYAPFWTTATTGTGGGYDRTVLEAMTTVKVGDTVRLEWLWSDQRRRVVKLEPWVPDVPAPTKPETPAPPAPVAKPPATPANLNPELPPPAQAP